MGRNRRDERIELEDDRDDRAPLKREADREDDRKAFDEPVFVDAIESPLHVPPELWPTGMRLRWVRIEAGGAADNTNWSKMTRIGWQPVKRGDNKGIDALFPQVAMPGQQGDGTGQAIVFGGLCLCMRDARLVARDKKRVEEETKSALRTVETYVEGGNSMFPRFNQSGPLQMETGRAPARFKE
jgi:hypothetical protein